MKSPRMFVALLLLMVGSSAFAAPEVLVQWTFAKPLKFTWRYYNNDQFVPPRKSESNFPLGRQTTVRHVKEAPFPSEFVPPSFVPAAGSVITPATPTSFETVWLGYEIKQTARREGSLIRLVGSLTLRDATAEQSVFGEDSGPIYEPTSINSKTKRVILSPNIGNMARVRTAESWFQVNAIPGKTYTVTLIGLDGQPLKATVRCTLRE